MNSVTAIDLITVKKKPFLLSREACSVVNIKKIQFIVFVYAQYTDV